MTTLCLCDWVDVSEDRQRNLLPIVRVAPKASERERVVVLAPVDAAMFPNGEGLALVPRQARALSS